MRRLGQHLGLGPGEAERFRCGVQGRGEVGGYFCRGALGAALDLADAAAGDARGIGEFLLGHVAARDAQRVVAGHGHVLGDGRFVVGGETLVLGGRALVLGSHGAVADGLACGYPGVGGFLRRHFAPARQRPASRCRAFSPADLLIIRFCRG
ncbi:hypothetical protein OG216_28705 [Streptomycetaceae bacterium NBC_01309]